MLLESNIVEGPYLQDILEQPDALRRTLDSLDGDAPIATFAGELAAGRWKTVVLTGMGSSLFALYPLHLRLLRSGLHSILIETAELIHYVGELLGRETLVIAVSQSGQSAEIVRMLEIATGASAVIAVTNDPTSRLARESSAAILIQAGVESTVSCKTYVCSLAALEWLGALMTGSDAPVVRRALLSAIPAVESYLADWKYHVRSLGPVIADVRHVFVVGRGPSLATAQTGGLILKESTRFAAEGMSSAALRHGPFEALAPHVLVMILEGDSRARDLNLRLRQDALRAGAKVFMVDSDPRCPEEARTILEILPVQMLSLALAAASGREAGRFELATKVTAVE